MSSGLRLAPVSYVVLGIIALRGSSTPYDLKRFIQISVGHFWPFPHTQLYDEPARLAAAGLLEETREQTGRRRRHYTITAEGLRRVTEWLTEPVETPPELRDLGLLKLFFSELGDAEEVAELAERQIAAHRAKLAAYDAVMERYGDRPEYARRLLTARLGIRLARTSAEFWEEVAADLEASEAATRAA